MANHVCPWWMGYILASPIRRLVENPEKVIGRFITPGMTILDVGCAMGYFTVPAAKMAGPSGKVIAVDLQPKMISSLQRRAKRRGLLDRIETRVASEDNLGIDNLEGMIDLVLAMYVVHEVPDRDGLFTQLHQVLRPQGRLFVAEPRGHVSPAEFEVTVAAAKSAGFREAERPATRGLACLFEK